MKLSKKQRSDVATLLRCAADSMVVLRHNWGYQPHPMNRADLFAADALGLSYRVAGIAVKAVAKTLEMSGKWPWRGEVKVQIAAALEAALLVEEGVLP